MSRPAARASRRSLLSGAVAGVALLATGCGTQDSHLPALDADSDLVDDVVGRIEAAQRVAAAARDAFPSLRDLGGDLTALHTAHLKELGRPGRVRATSPVGGTAATARDRLLQVETKLQARLVDAALAAESGALAQTFAAMAAAIAQRRAVAA